MSPGALNILYINTSPVKQRKPNTKEIFPKDLNPSYNKLSLVTAVRSQYTDT